MNARLIHALTTTLLWGVWGAFAGLPGEQGVSETINYVVWSLTMIRPRCSCYEEAVDRSRATGVPSCWV